MKARRQSGAALLAAMLVVTLVATFAAAALWQQWRTVEVERAERARIQSSWILTGALDWARLILREDGRAGGPDHLGEPWSAPLQEARLTSFLQAEQATSTEIEAENAFLSGQVLDLQSLLNASNLASAGTVNDTAFKSFQRLFELLGLPLPELSRLAENMRFASDISTDNRSATQAPLQPQKVEQLVWLGLSPRTVATLMPYVTVLPGTSTPVNLNTAGAEVIYAALPGISLADAQRIVQERDRSPFRLVTDAARLLDLPGGMPQQGVSVASNFFEVRGRLRLGTMTVEERSVVKREGIDVKTLSRERGLVDAGAMTRLVQGR